MFQVILYYNFTSVNNPENFCREHKEFCQSLGLMGRVYIAAEGINGTLAGTVEHIEAYKKALTCTSGFEATEFKTDDYDHIPFVKLIVKTRREIVALKTDFNFDLNNGGKHVSPKQWKQMLESGEEFVLIDVRNKYETDIGRFEGAVCPDVENFYDFPKWLKESQLPKDKKVLMYCTGGIRCEKFSVYMKEQGYGDISQLHGGIINYANEVGDAHYKGKCFVFDDRLAVDVERGERTPLTQCAITGKPCDAYLNCANPDCNKLFICSQEGARLMEGACCEDCRNAPRRKPFNPENIYEPTRKWYVYKERITLQ